MQSIVLGLEIHAQNKQGWMNKQAAGKHRVAGRKWETEVQREGRDKQKIKKPLCVAARQVLYNAMTHRDHPVGQVTSARNLHGPQDGQTHMTPAQTAANHCGHS